MKIYALEEHFVVPEALAAWAAVPTVREDLTGQYSQGEFGEFLPELGERRLAEMDDEGIDVQVLSLNTPGPQNLAPAEAVSLARLANDRLASVIGEHPDRFQGFATLPTPDPPAAAAELRRAVEELGLKGAMLHGRTGERNVDDRAFDELWSTAAELRVPVYIHPQVPQRAVRDVYYSGLGDIPDAVFAAHGYGWHLETGLQLLRLIYSGAFDRHPDLQVIVGHWGEVALFFAERIEWGMDRVTELERPLHEYLAANVFYTPSGMFSQRYLAWALEVVGADRLMFSVDYPYTRAAAGAGQARAFLEAAPIDQEAKKKIASGNWEALTRR